MLIKNASIFMDGRFATGAIQFCSEKGTITGLFPDDIMSGDRTLPQDEILDAGGGYLIPGLIDVHTHAAVGEDASDGSAEGFVKMSEYYAAEGVTSWLPTTMTLKEPVLTKAMNVVRDFKRPEKGSKLAGINLEGPFLSYAKRGAQAADNLNKPDIDMFKRLNDASGDNILLVTVAPEEEGGIDFIKEASELCTVSVGHSVADYETAMEAFQAGATHVTHLYNGMNGLAHRNPGPLGAAFDCGATVELIPDGFHIHPSVIRLTSALFGSNLVLISDSLRCAGMPDGEYELGGQPITMINSKATLKGTDTLAGSSIHLMEGVRRAHRYGLSLETAVYAATAAPAMAVGIDYHVGHLRRGYDADLVLLDRELNVKAVFVNGHKVR